ncbi:hypothetical protein BACPLE_01019 [Phocaeicola plebeius DSM 17135]|uniref:Uncharacterized protein n=1 Tax=Phocaeicola plebeius (strain DSM 17135 / JCM 12973 / CCUG 54634 / M2) TaxID=484018 RepID=B5CWC9_PHOPM|nr:hypothetical protein BACPLE_01019 [Phocaeicola plebeius DSM 17135]
MCACTHLLAYRTVALIVRIFLDDVYRKYNMLYKRNKVYAL